MDDIELALRDAWDRVYPRLQSDPSELARRLARRNLALLQRPPRAWCLAIRASDTRINPATAILCPEDAAYPGRPDLVRQHTVLLKPPLIRALCTTVHLPPGVDMQFVSKQLGVHAATLRHAMRTGRFHVVYYKGLSGRRGRPVPTLQPRRGVFLPSAGVCAGPPDPVWGSIWPLLADQLPGGFQQSVTRIPIYRQQHRNPYHTSLHFRGWRWICPSCKKPARIILYPFPPLSFPEYLGLPVPLSPPPRCTDRTLFACTRCHRVRNFTRTHSHGWNEFVAYASAGLLYGHEVAKPPGYHDPSFRKRAYRPSLMRPPSRRREQVLKRLLQGIPYAQIAADLGIGYATVHAHVKIIYKQHVVHGLHGLARKLGVTLPPRPSPKREEVRRRLASGQTYRQIANAMGLTYSAVHELIKRMRRAAKRGMEPVWKIRAKGSCEHSRPVLHPT